MITEEENEGQKFFLGNDWSKLVHGSFFTDKNVKL